MMKMVAKKKVATLVVASAIAVGALATGAYAYSDNIRTLIYTGVGKIVTQLTPSINTALDQHQNSINAQIAQDAASAKDYALQALQEYRDTLIAEGVQRQNSAYQALKAQFDQDVEEAIDNAKDQLGGVSEGKINENVAEGDAALKAALEAIVNQ